MSSTDGNLMQIPVMVSGLREIQELHKPFEWSDGAVTCGVCIDDDEVAVTFPCATRQLADKALGKTNG